MVRIRIIGVAIVVMIVAVCSGAPGDDHLSCLEGDAYLCLYSLRFKQEKKVPRVLRSAARSKVKIPPKGASAEYIRTSYDKALANAEKNRKHVRQSPDAYNVSRAEFMAVARFIWLTRGAELGWNKKNFDILASGCWEDHTSQSNTLTYDTFMDILGMFERLFGFHDDDEGEDENEGNFSGDSSRSNSEEIDFSSLLSEKEARYCLTAYSLERDGDVPSWWRGLVSGRVDLCRCIRMSDVAPCYNEQRATLPPLREVRTLHTYVTRQEAKQAMQARYGDRHNKSEIDTTFSWYWEEYASNKLALSSDDFAAMKNMFDQYFTTKRAWSLEQGGGQADALSDQIKRMSLTERK